MGINPVVFGCEKKAMPGVDRENKAMPQEKKPLISVVVPVYYNAETLKELHARFNRLAEAVPDCSWEFIYVDDGSKDDSFKILMEIKAGDDRVGLLRFVKNAGSHSAILAGLSFAKGDAVAFISADLQDDPMLLAEMAAEWKEGTPVVLAVREGREDSLADKLLAKAYYFTIRGIAIPEMPEGGFDFALLDRSVVDIITDMQEKNTTLTGLIAWLGFPHKIIPYIRKAREKGNSKWTLRKKVKLTVDSILAFSYLPVRFISLLGVLIFLGTLLYVGIIFAQKVLFGIPVQGWASLMVAILLLSGIQMLSLGVLGEYIWRVLDAGRKRPPYIVYREFGSKYSREA